MLVRLRVKFEEKSDSIRIWMGRYYLEHFLPAGPPNRFGKVTLTYALSIIITNIPSSRAEVLSTPVSDHQPIVVSAPTGRLRKLPAERAVRSWSRAD